MSIELLLKDRVQRNMLHLMRPRARGTSVRRILLIGERLWTVLNSTSDDNGWETRIGQLLADLETFVVSSVIRPEYLFGLYPRSKCVWEIRSIQDDPSIRIFGLFAQKDIFVATNFALRRDLKGWNSREWKQERRNAAAEWHSLLHPYSPIRANSINDVVSGATNGKFFKT